MALLTAQVSKVLVQIPFGEAHVFHVLWECRVGVTSASVATLHCLNVVPGDGESARMTPAPGASVPDVCSSLSLVYS